MWVRVCERGACDDVCALARLCEKVETDRQTDRQRAREREEKMKSGCTVCVRAKIFSYPEQAGIARNIVVLWAVSGPASVRGFHYVSDGLVQLRDVQLGKIVVVLLFGENRLIDFGIPHVVKGALRLRCCRYVRVGTCL